MSSAEKKGPFLCPLERRGKWPEKKSPRELLPAEFFKYVIVFMLQGSTRLDPVLLGLCASLNCEGP